MSHKFNILTPIVARVHIRAKMMKSNKRYLSCFLLWTLMSLLCTLTLPLYAQGEIDVAKWQFDRIYDIQDIDADREYVISIRDSIKDGGKWIYKRFALSAKANKKKLKATVITEVSEGHIETSDTSLIWHFRRDEDKWQLVSSRDNRSVLSQGTDLCTTDKGGTKWNIIPVGDGSFYFRNDTEGRCLGTNMTSGTSCYFGCYLNDLVNGMHAEIYVESNDFVEKGTVSLPEYDTHVVLAARDSLYTMDVDGRVVAHQMQTKICQDGCVANDGSLPLMQYKYCENNSFALYDPTGNPLDEKFCIADEPYVWRAYNGYIVSADSTVRYLAKSDAGISLMTLDEALLAHAMPIGISVAGESAASDISSDGCMTLSGAWSAERLAELDWAGVSVLDLSKMSLPLQLAAFKYRDPSVNTIIYVAKESVATIPQHWYFTVSCGDETNFQLIRAAHIVDRADLTLLYPFYAESGTLTYSRQMSDDGGWETLCLPFDCTMPDEVSAGACLSVENGQLQCEAIKKVEAGNAVLVRKNADAKSSKAIVWTNASGWVTDVINVENCLQGTYTQVQYDQSEESKYLLDNAGMNFVRVRSGSTLPPFRAELHTTSSTMHSIPPVISAIAQSHKHHLAPVMHSIDGKMMIDTMTNGNQMYCPTGVYIVAGKKFLKYKR